MHNERKDLIQLWEDAVDTIHKRDEAIHKTAEDFARKKSQLRQEKHQLDELAEKLAKEIVMNVCESSLEADSDLHKNLTSNFFQIVCIFAE